MTPIDLDRTPPPVRSRPWPAPVVAGLVAVAMLLALVVVVVLRAAPAPALQLRARWLPASARVPTALVWYVDGTQEDVTGRLGAEEWRPERPVRQLVVVAEVACEIRADGAVVAAASSEGGRYAVCVWTP